MYGTVKFLLAFISLLFLHITAKTTIHLVPHTHQDAGWIRSFEEYAISKTRNSYKTFQNMKEPFIYQEMSFLRDALENGGTVDAKVLDRMEIVGGGWTLADEACVSYEDYITDMEVGHQYAKQLYEKHGKTLQIRSAWNVDPFGHSRAISLDMSIAMGLKYVVINRISRELKEKWREEKNLQFQWCINESKCILTHLTYDHYASPDGFKFDGDGRDPIFAPDSTLAQKLCDFSKQVSKWYHADVLIPYGDDFTHTSYEPIKKLNSVLSYISQNNVCPDFDFKISTLDTYFNDLQNSLKAKNIQLPKLEIQDFFPYNQFPGSKTDYWTGYFTSHSTFKRNIRDITDHLRTSNMVASLHVLQDMTKNETHEAHNFDTMENALQSLSEVAGILQHHDGITGTSKRYVREDYADMIRKARDKMSPELHSSVSILIGETHGTTMSYHHPNKIFSVNEDDNIPILAMNNLGYPVTTFIRLKLSNKLARIYAVDENTNSEIEIPYEVVSVPNSGFELHFLASNIPALGFQTYFIAYDKDAKVVEETIVEDGNTELVTPFVKLKFSEYKLSNISVARPDQSLPFSKEHELSDSLFFYSTSNRQGAYVFDADKSEEIEITNRKLYLTNGKYVKRVRIELVDAKIRARNIPSTLTYTLYNEGSSISNLPVDIEISTNLQDLQYVDMTLVYRVSSKIESSKKFYTDANGYSIMERIYDEERRIAGNYFPSTQITYIHDSERTMCLLLRESHGVSSQKSGEIEIGLAQISVGDDGKGLGEAINVENHPTISNFKLAFLEGTFASSDPKSIPEYKIRNLARLFDHSPSIFVSKESTTTASDYKKNHVLSLSPISNSDERIHLVSFNPLISKSSTNQKRFVLRLHNTDRMNPIPSFDLTKYFVLPKLNVTGIEEWTLTLLQKKDSVVNPQSIPFDANEIRTFIVEFSIPAPPAPPSPPSPEPTPVPSSDNSTLLLLMTVFSLVIAIVSAVLLGVFIVLGIMRGGWLKKRNTQTWTLLNEFQDDDSDSIDLLSDVNIEESQI